jgi:hypothetical protein
LAEVALHHLQTTALKEPIRLSVRSFQLQVVVLVSVPVVALPVMADRVEVVAHQGQGLLVKVFLVVFLTTTE